MKFTDRYIASVKPAAERYFVWESAAHGQGNLGLRVFPTGKKSWVYMYRHGGRAKMLTLGSYPMLSVADAHAAAAQAAKERSTGLDPGSVVVAARAAARAAPTFAELATEYMQRYARPRKRTADRDQQLLDRDVLPTLGQHKASAIERRDIRALLQAIVERGAPIQANRVLALVRKVYNWGVVEDMVPANPCDKVPAPGVERRRERVLTESELRAVLAALPHANMSYASRLALLLQLLTAQRCGEVASMRWDEIDLAAAWWTIPVGKAKNRRSHRVPLSPSALLVLREARALSPSTATVFPSPRGDAPMIENALSRAVLRNRDAFTAAARALGGDAGAVVEAFTPHDLRRTAASHMTGLGVSRLVVAKLLNHADASVTAVYDRHSYDGEKRAAVEQWAARLAELGLTEAVAQSTQSALRREA